MRAVLHFVWQHPYVFGVAGAYLAFVFIWFSWLVKHAPHVSEDDTDQ